MARFKHIDMSPRLLPVDFAQQVLPGTFEYALCHLVDHELDLSELEARFRNDKNGAPAYAPSVLIKIVLLAYSRGIVSSRAMQRACLQNVLFMAVSGDAQPDHSTLAAFVSGMGEVVAQLFARVLVVCDRQGLIGRELFAIDGVKLPSNAGKARSGTRQEFVEEAERMEAAVTKMIEHQRAADAAGQSAKAQEAEREARTIKRLSREAEHIRTWLTEHPEDRSGPTGGLRKSNRTDNESAKMATSKGVIQGYTGVATVDGQHQIVVDAQAHGTGAEQELLLTVVDALQPLLGENTALVADAGYHSEANLDGLAERGVDAWIADPQMRSRDPRFAEQKKHKDKPDPLHDKSAKPNKGTKRDARFKPADFDFDQQNRCCICPAGKQLYGNGSECTINGYRVMKFQGAKQDCQPCPLRDQCLRNPEKTISRQVSFFLGRRDGGENRIAQMKTRIDSPTGRRRIGQRFAAVEPVFGNLRGNKRLDRFTLRGRRKVDGQWKLYCMVHNIEKLAHHGYAL
jgi:transposase